ncbi:hypothetical protein SEA_JEEVES_32 [Mycobacterium phage Jeeves]|uniref:Glycine-rich domain-containing protein n=1 Tax=Mycobacterium phage Jeeves TaxID=2652402 RepID=A0A5J6T470_9CAUD|nr:minor tail protein [Mycobacterium phage Jeeves]QFG04507.1 hypothetical protein SEA_JEEVES_32 [Mycobacterium phage Jeeves]
MTLYLGGTLVGSSKVYLGSTPASKIYLGTTQIWPSFDPVGQTFTATGAYTYNIPAGATFIDVVLLSGGGGGQGQGSFSTWGKGGDPGTWLTYTLVRGVDIPMGTLTITGSVGVGGTAGAGSVGISGGAGGPGGATTAVATGWSGTHSAAGGSGGSGGTLILSETYGKSPGDTTLNGRLYQGGAQQTGASTAGNPPGGGGGAARITFQAGAAGARGQVWFYAY